MITGVLFGANRNQECINDGSGNFTCSNSEVNLWASDFETGDLDNDGDIDLFMPQAAPNQVCLNDGFANFTCSTINSENFGSRWTQLGDVDGDGDLDAAFVNVGTQSQICINNGSAGFSCSFIPSSDTQRINLADFDGDGDLDVMAGDAGRTNKILTNQ